MPPLHNPRETIVRKVLLIPADGTLPRIVAKTFSEAASEANPESHYTRSVDLRSHYRKYMATTHCNLASNENPGDGLKANEGHYVLYSNISPGLPINQCAARVVGVDPINFESKLFWRGDIIIVKDEDWPGPLVVGGGNHRNYLNVDPSFQTTSERLLKYLHESRDLQNWIKSMAEFERSSVQTDRLMRRMQTESLHIPVSNMAPLDVTKRNKKINLWKKIAIYYGEAEVEMLSKKVCALCTKTGTPDLKACAGCRQILYCSRDCQKEDWMYHKRECKPSKET